MKNGTKISNEKATVRKDHALVWATGLATKINFELDCESYFYKHHIHLF